MPVKSGEQKLGPSPSFSSFSGQLRGLESPLPISLLTFVALSRASRFIFGPERSYFRAGVPSKDEEQPDGLQVCLRLRDGKSGQGALTVHFWCISAPPVAPGPLSPNCMQ
eukprot:COSAG01_NODE_2663_length_7293_cov_5.946483_7_plen_110_part_00